jgi:hypothetical protein
MITENTKVIQAEAAAAKQSLAVPSSIKLAGGLDPGFLWRGPLRIEDAARIDGVKRRVFRDGYFGFQVDLTPLERFPSPRHERTQDP